jgi:hypothetical protein
MTESNGLFRCAHLCQAILVEMKNYGLILAANRSNWYFQGSASPQWPDALASLLKGYRRGSSRLLMSPARS